MRMYVVLLVCIILLVIFQGTIGVTEGFICGCSGQDKLLPVSSPLYNLREICKNMILLEDHLFQKGKRCTDCIKKHFLTIEGLAEELVTLDHSRNYPKYHDIPDKIRAVEREYIAEQSHHATAQQLRRLRKQFMSACFDSF